jgi:aminoglycoside phosphotransferase (APT) family kinase protein
MQMEQTKLAELRARRALVSAGLASGPDVSVTRVESVTNEVWERGDVVIRVSGSIGRRLRREAALAGQLLPGVLYPAIVAVGEEGGIDWLVLDRVPGEPLVRCWPGLDIAQRRTAIEHLAGALRALHETPAPLELADRPDGPHPLSAGPNAVAPVFAVLERASALRWVDRGMIADAIDLVGALGEALGSFTSATLVHGDLHFQNVLWNGDHVSALLDLEYARAAPPDLDLDVFLRFCAFPVLFVPVGREAEAHTDLYADVPHWLRDAYPELFAHPRLFDRLRVYAIAFDAQDLVANPPRMAVSKLTSEHPYHRLGATVRGRSHIDALARS